MASWLRGLLGREAEPWDGLTGRPRSTNGASSLHLAWDVPDGEWVEAQVSLEVVTPPSVPELDFWALQVSFHDRGRDRGAGHLGLQWHRGHPGGTAVNWGGYDQYGNELNGSESSLPSALYNVNTRDYGWLPHRPYRLRVRLVPDSPGVPHGFRAWRGEVTDLVTGEATVVRELWNPGDRLAGPLVWTENFADCDDAGSAVRWSGLELTDVAGDVHEVGSVRVNYQSLDQGGCAATDSSIEDGAVVQRTSTARITEQGAVLRLR